VVMVIVVMMMMVLRSTAGRRVDRFSVVYAVGAPWFA